ncbi:unannotated protein [freshwater metagenome]|uniref:Unannotated protein n=1 Tax=freshwater metagenome TaxID=449393 RepID=A0A6J6CD25_9ZZZZ
MAKAVGSVTAFVLKLSGVGTPIVVVNSIGIKEKSPASTFDE